MLLHYIAPGLEDMFFVRALFVFILSALRYTLFAGGAYLLFYVWKRRDWFYKKIQQKYPEQRRIIYEMRYSFTTFAIIAVVITAMIMLSQQGYTRLYTDIAEYGWFYFFASFGIAALIHDTYFYWMHRLMHHPKLFKHVHKVHHMSHNPTPWAAFSFHPIEAILEFGFVPFMVIVFPFHPIILVSFGIYMITLNVMGHLGFEVFPKGFTQHWFFRWFNSSTHHNMHHKHVNCNYGLYYNVWDYLMGTNHKKYHQTFEEVANRPKPAKEPDAESADKDLKPAHA